MFNLSKSSKVNFAKLYHGSIHLIDHLPIVRKRRRRRRALKAIKISSYIITILLLILVIFFATLFYTGKQIYLTSNSAKQDLIEAYNNFQVQDYQTAFVYAQNAENKLNFASEQLDLIRESYIVSLLRSDVEIENIEYLLDSFIYISRTLSDTSQLANNFETVVSNSEESLFNTITREDRRKILKQIYEIEPELNGLKANIDLALVNLANFKTGTLLSPLRKSINNLNLQLKQSQNLLNEIIPISKSLPLLVGYPQEARYLVVIQNNDELRATGGKINVIGILDIDSGDITNFFTYPAFMLNHYLDKELLQLKFSDGSLKEDNLNFSEINNQPDWPTTARILESFYSDFIIAIENNAPILIKEPSLTNILPARPLTGVIGVTPDIFSELIKYTGEINYNNHKYNEQTFTDLIKLSEEEITLAKDILLVGELLKDLKIKIINLPTEDWDKVVGTIIDNIRQKNILAYITDSKTQEMLNSLGFSGEIKTNPGDYVMVVDTTENSEVKDTAVSRSINYIVEQGSNGLFSQLELYYANSSYLSLTPAIHETYTRLYVPSQSRLIQSDGIELGEIKITEALGKTVYGMKISVGPSEIKKITLKYQLPDSINNNLNTDSYNLLIQRQPGKATSQLLVDLKFLDDIKAYSPTGFYVVKPNKNSLSWKTDLKSDKNFIVDF